MIGIAVSAVFGLIVIGFALTPIAFMIKRPRLAYTSLACAFIGFGGFVLLASIGSAAQ